MYIPAVYELEAEDWRKISKLCYGLLEVVENINLMRVKSSCICLYINPHRQDKQRLVFPAVKLTAKKIGFSADFWQMYSDSLETLYNAYICYSELWNFEKGWKI